MAKDITDANDVAIKVGSKLAGGTSGVLIISDFEFGDDPQKEKKYGVGNEYAKGRTSGNREITLSFTKIGEDADIAQTIKEGNFSVVLRGDVNNYEIDEVDGAYTISISDGGDYEFEFDGDALNYEIV